MSRKHSGDYYTKRPLAMKEAMMLCEEFRPKNVLDIGAGTGELQRAFRSLGVICEAIDIRPMSPSVRMANIEDIPYPNGSFDMVTAFGVLDYVNLLWRAFSEIRRVLVSGGIIVGAVSVKGRGRPNIMPSRDWNDVLLKKALPPMMDNERLKDDLLNAILLSSTTLKSNIAKLVGYDNHLIQKELHKRFAILLAQRG